MNLFMKGCKTWFINFMNVLDAFINPNNMTNYSYNSSFVLKVIFHLSPGCIWIWWYSLLKSIFEKIVALNNWSSMSSNHGIGNLYPTMISLMARLSIHMRQLPSFFGISKAGTKHGLNLSWIIIFFSNSSIFYLKISLSFGLIL